MGTSPAMTRREAGRLVALRRPCAAGFLRLGVDEPTKPVGDSVGWAALEEDYLNTLTNITSL
jgi:hypothetical protein